MTSGKYGEEYPKTFGHYHGAQVLETYHIISGEGVMQLQKKFMEQKMWVPEKVTEVFLVSVKAGEEITISPEYGHSLSNVGNLPLIAYDNWTAGHSPTDYAMVEKLQGLAYYLINDGGKVKAVANLKYVNLPEPVWMSAEEYKSLKGKPA
jgi:oxalate decarboxylase/phosphoglucose isomerase-like protein (cupin superfamily)